MKQVMYFIIEYESVRMLTREELLQEIAEQMEDVKNDEEVEAPTFLDSIPDTDPAYWGEGRLIIKGEIVVPEPRQVVTRYEIE